MNKYFLIVGFDLYSPFVARFTLKEIMTNSGEHKDSELFYALSELHGHEIINTPIGHKPVLVRTNRDIEFMGLLLCVTEEAYKQVEEDHQTPESRSGSPDCR